MLYFGELRRCHGTKYVRDGGWEAHTRLRHLWGQAITVLGCWVSAVRVELKGRL